MINRRSFLLTGTVALSALLSGCGNREKAEFSVLLLNQSLPNQLISQFRKQLTNNPSLSFVPQSQLKDILTLLETWHEQATSDTPPQKNRWQLPFIGKKATPPANLVTLGDTWLQKAIENRLIEPLTPDTLPEWTRLHSRWKKLVQRNSEGFWDVEGEIWGVPYRWGTTMIVYNQEALKQLDWTVQDWGDLWDERLRDRIGIISQPREIIGLTLKKLGKSYNEPTLSNIPNLKSELQTLLGQIKQYDSEHYLQTLLMKDTYVAVGWSSDILPVLENYPQLKAIVPPSGTALWSDIWVQPAHLGSPNLALTKKWLNFCWEESTALTLSLFTDAVSPVLMERDRATLPKALENNPQKLPAEEILNKSEFIEPLPPETQKEYNTLWEEMALDLSIQPSQLFNKSAKAC